MILLSKCKWLEAMLGAKNTEWTKTKTTAQPQCHRVGGPLQNTDVRTVPQNWQADGVGEGSSLLMSKLLPSWGTESMTPALLLCLSS